MQDAVNKKAGIACFEVTNRDLFSLFFALSAPIVGFVFVVRTMLLSAVL